MTKSVQIGREALTRPALKTERVEVPEWDGYILLRSMSAAQTADLAAYADAQAAGDAHGLRYAAWVIVACWVDDAGTPMLGVGDIDDLLATQTPAVINRLGTAALRISGLTSAAIEQAEKNFAPRQNGDSGTG